MKNLLRKHFLYFLSILLFNFSIDTPDYLVYGPHYSAHEDLSINEQESITEFVLENLLGIENAVPENDEDDAVQNLGKILLFCHDERKIFQLPENKPFIFTKNTTFTYHSSLLEYITKINPRPPKVRYSIVA